MYKCYKKSRGSSPPPQTLALSFFIIIAVGACLLKLPIASTTYISWVDALFTATSATTVTGLTVVNTGEDYNPPDRKNEKSDEFNHDGENK